MATILHEGELSALLRLAAGAVPAPIAVAEAWIPPAPTIVGGGGWQLASFHTPTPLVVSSRDDSGAAVERVIDLRLARAFASQHQLSARLVSEVAESGAVVWSQDLRGDALFERLTFPVATVMAVPLLGVGVGGGGACIGALVLYTSTKLEVSCAALRAGG